jgi:hypothetical protein
VGLLGGGVLADLLQPLTRVSRFWLLIASLVLCAPSLHFLGSSETLASTRIAAAAFGLSSGLMMGNIFPAAFEIVPLNARASAVGVLNLCGGLVSGCAMFFGGLWKQSLGIHNLLSLTAAAYVIAGVLLAAGAVGQIPRDLQADA